MSSKKFGAFIEADSMTGTLTYQALLTQTGTSAGLFTATFSSPVLTAGKTAVILSNPLATLVSYFAVVTSTSVITINTGLSANVATVLTSVPTDSLLTSTIIQIIVSD